MDVKRIEVKFDVFGQRMLVQRRDQQWILYKDSDTGIKARIYDVVIPDDLELPALASYLSDIYHEYVTDKHPEVVCLTKI